MDPCTALIHMFSVTFAQLQVYLLQSGMMLCHTATLCSGAPKYKTTPRSPSFRNLLASLKGFCSSDDSACENGKECRKSQIKCLSDLHDYTSQQSNDAGGGQSMCTRWHYSLSLCKCRGFVQCCKPCRPIKSMVFSLQQTLSEIGQRYQKIFRSPCSSTHTPVICFLHSVSA